MSHFDAMALAVLTCACRQIRKSGSVAEATVLAPNSHRTDTPSEIGPTAIYLSRPKGLGSLTR